MVMQDINLKRFVSLSTDFNVDEYKEGLNKYSKENFIEYFLEMQKEDLETGKDSNYDDSEDIEDDF